ncbi:MAG: TonB-dependent receptor, partial [Chloroflexia bacterium]|nr:TonB-dependent receptor [Chloroflexia bacterium]
MRKIICLILFSLSTNFILAQTITVLDQTNLTGIENVYIYSSSQSALTNKSGKANISQFTAHDTLIFQHPSYKTFSVAYANLKDNNFIVKLEEGVIDINEVVISANRWEQNKGEVPNQILTLRTKDIENSNVQTSADLLGTVAGVYIQKSQLGGGSPMIRGFATNRILIVVDGVRMNNAIYRSGNLQNIISIDPNSTETAEIIMGPGTVIYGSDAIGGVMDFHSLSPALSENGIRFNAGAMARYSTANQEQTGHFHFSIGGKKFGLLTSVTYSDFGDLRMGSSEHDEYTRPEYVSRINGRDTVLINSDPNIQKQSAYNQINLMQKIRFQPNSTWDIQYGFHYSKLGDVPRYDRLIEYSGGSLKYGDWYYGPQEWMMHTLNVLYSGKSSLFDQMKVVAAYQDYEESRHDRRFGRTNLRQRYEMVKAGSINLDFDKSLDDKSTLFYGFELVYNLVNSTGHETDIETGETTPYASRYPDESTYSSAAAYLDYKYKINEQLSLNAGLRYNQVWLNAEFDNTFYPFPFKKMDINNGALNGSLGLVYNNASNWQFKLNASTGFRSPNIDDVGKVFDSEPGNVVVPNQDLKPEYAYNLEFGIAKTIQSKIQIESAVFYTWLNNAMVRRDFTFGGEDSIMYDGEVSKVQALTNASNAYVYGIQVMLQAELFRNLYIKSSLTYTKGEEQDESDVYTPLRHAAPLFGSTHLIYRREKLNIDLYSVYNSEISNKNLAPSEIAKPTIYATDSNGNPYCPAWYTLNLKAGYQMQRFSWNIGLQNLLDAAYRVHGSGVDGVGRSV